MANQMKVVQMQAEEIQRLRLVGLAVLGFQMKTVQTMFDQMQECLVEEMQIELKKRFNDYTSSLPCGGAAKEAGLNPENGAWGD